MLRFLLLFLCVVSLNASIDCCKNGDALLQKSQIYLDKQSLSFEEIQENATFSAYTSSHINLGFLKDTTLWIRLELHNTGGETLIKVLEIHNPLLEQVRLFSTDSKEKEILPFNEHESINTAFTLKIAPYETKFYYLKVSNSTTSLRLGISLKNQMNFIYEDHHQQMIIFVFISILVMLFLYNLVLYGYTKSKAYLYYSLYLATLIFQQSTYLGVTQMFLPAWFLYFDNLGVVFKVNAMYITAALFAKSFLLSKNYPRLDRVYNFIIIVAIIEMPLFGFPWFYVPEVAILTGLFFVLFNIFAAIYIYKKGYKQARLFVIGWSFLVIGYSLMILDGLGVFSIMHKMPNIILIFTTFEAIVLSLAFTDRYMILKEDKQKSDLLLLNALQERQKVIEYEIHKQTKELNNALESKKILLKELHHRTKNNLQLILSLIRMQADQGSKAIQTYSKSLESRINAIARTHEMLYLNKNLDDINMQEYIERFCEDIQNFCEKEMEIVCSVEEIYMPLREAGYVGLIINEIVTNSIKYVTKEPLIIHIKMLKNGDKYRVEIYDNGRGLQDKIKKGIGMKLIHTLAEEQLDGMLQVYNENGLHYLMEYSL